MGLLAVGQVVVLPFPYSDLSHRKLRPALLLATAGHEDWIACQITSNPFADPLAVELTAISFAAGGLRHTSYVRPAKLFTAHESLFAAQVGTITPTVLSAVRNAVISALHCS